MNQTKQAQKKTIILWSKRAAGIATIILWEVILYTIFQSGCSFNDQDTKCMISPLTLFGALSAVYMGVHVCER
jgi:TRAP-type C4-dicarboxylate transport system permease small subunit